MKSLTINKDNYFVVDGKTTTVKYNKPCIGPDSRAVYVVTKVVHNDLKNHGVTLDEVNIALRNYNELQ